MCYRVEPIWRVQLLCGLWNGFDCAAWEPRRACCAANCPYGQPLHPEFSEADREFIAAHGPHYRDMDGPRGEWVRLSDPAGLDEVAFCNSRFEEAARWWLLNQPFENAFCTRDGYRFVIRMADEAAAVPVTPEEAAAIVREAIAGEPAVAGVDVTVQAEHDAGQLIVTLDLRRSPEVEQQVPALARAGLSLLKRHFPSVVAPWLFTFEELVASGWQARAVSRFAWEVVRPGGDHYAFIANRDRRNRPLKFPIQALKVFHELQVLDAVQQGRPVPDATRCEVRGT